MVNLITLYLYTTGSSILFKPSLIWEAIRKGVTLLTGNSDQSHAVHHQMKSSLKGRPHTPPLVSELVGIALLRPCGQF